MARSEQELLRRLCSKNDTLIKARDLLNIAKAKTAPGSGHSLGGNTLGLPAICAFLASQHVGNDDVTEKMAQQASCLSLKAFRASINIVSSALSSYLQYVQDESKDTMFEELSQSYMLADSAIEWMNEVFILLRKSGVLEQEGFDPHSKEVQCAIFSWVAVALHFRKIKSADLMGNYKIKSSDFRVITEIIDENCFQIQAKMDRYLTQASPSHSSRTASTTPSPKKAKLARILSPNTPMQKKRQQFLNESPQSPIKKRKINHYPDSIPISFLNIPTTPQRRTNTISPAESLKKSLPTEKRINVTPTRPKMAEAESEEVLATNTKMQRLAVTDTITPRKEMAYHSSIPTQDHQRRENFSALTTRSNTITVEDVGDELRAAQNQSQRRTRTAFRDRLFWQYQDPRVVAEWKACEEYVRKSQHMAI